MNRSLIFVGRFDAATCPRCGNGVARDHRYCSVCGALLPSARTAPPPRVTAVRAEAYEAGFPDSGFRHVGQYPNGPLEGADRPLLSLRPPSLTETVTIKSALLVALSLSVATGAIVYFLSTPQLPKPIVTEIPAAQAQLQQDASVQQEPSEPDAMPTTGYLSDKTLHQIDVSIKPPAVRDAVTSNTSPGTVGTTSAAGDSQQHAGESNDACQPNCQTNANVQPAKAPPHKSIFSEVSDPAALERIIHQYGWSKVSPSP